MSSARLVLGIAIGVTAILLVRAYVTVPSELVQAADDAGWLAVDTTGDADIPDDAIADNSDTGASDGSGSDDSSEYYA